MAHPHFIVTLATGKEDLFGNPGGVDGTRIYAIGSVDATTNVYYTQESISRAPLPPNCVIRLRLLPRGGSGAVFSWLTIAARVTYDSAGSPIDYGEVPQLTPVELNAQIDEGGT